MLPSLALILLSLVPAKQATRDDPVLGAELVVDGERVTFDALRRHLIYGVGRLQIELRLADQAVERELWERADSLARSPREGAPPADILDARARQAVVAERLAALRRAVEPTEAEVEAELAHEARLFESKYPTRKADAWLWQPYGGPEEFRAFLRRRLRFDRVFLPPDPADWPTVTLEAMHAESDESRIQQARSGYEARRLAAARSGSPIARESATYEEQLRDVVRSFVVDFEALRTAAEHVPESVIAESPTGGPPRVVSWSTEELWRAVSGAIDADAVRDAKRWFVARIATERRLAREGLLLDEREACAAFRRFGLDLGGLRHPRSALDEYARSTLCLPSLEAFHDYHRLEESLRRNASAPQVAALLLKAREQAKRLLGGTKVDVDALLVSAYDFEARRWKRGGWSWAEERVRSIAGELAALEGDLGARDRRWLEILAEHGEYGKRRVALYGYDIHSRGRQPGRWQDMDYDALARGLGESTCTRFLRECSIADHVFLEQVPRSIAGPLLGPDGYYLTRLNRVRLGGEPRDDLETILQVEDLAVERALAEYAAEAVVAARVVGIDG